MIMLLPNWMPYKSEFIVRVLEKVEFSNELTLIYSKVI